MPYARVGAMPQPTHPEDHDGQHGRGRGSRQHGITMQDLKKQTAMRLAQEQHQQRSATRSQQQNYHAKSQNHHTGSNSQSQRQMPYQPSHNSSPNNYYDYYGNQQQYNYGHPFHYGQTSPSTSLSNDDIPKRQSPHASFQIQQRPKYQVSKTEPPVQRQTYQISPQHAPPPPPPPPQVPPSFSVGGVGIPSQTTPSHKWQLDMLSETSSIRSYEYDCNASSASAVEVAEAASTVSGGSGSRYNNTPRNLSSLAAASTEVVGPVSPLPQSLSSGGHEYGRGNARPQNMDSLSVLSNSSSKGSHKTGSSASSSTVPATTSSRSHHHVGKGKRGGKKSSLAQALDQHQAAPSPQQPSPKNFYRQHHQPLRSPQSEQSTTSHNRSQQQPSSQKQNFTNTQKHNKLPHGLTVHELKEMTRARLAAEAAAAEKQEHVMSLRQASTTSSDGATPNRHQSPQKKDYRRQNEGSVRQSPSWSSSRTTPAPQPLTRQQQTSSYNSPVKQPAIQDQRQLHLDSLETTSVTSFNSTLGSESVHSSSFLGAGLQPPSNSDDAMSAMSFTRSWSYPAGGTSTRESFDAADTSPSTSSFFDLPCGMGGLGGVRRRLGSSPPGFHLEVPHEDRPLDVGEELSLSMFGGLASRSDPGGSYSPERFRYDHVGTEGKEEALKSLAPLNNDCSRMSSDLPNWVAESVLLAPASLLSLHDGNRAVSSDDLCNLQHHNRQRSLTDYSNISTDSSILRPDAVFRGEVGVGASTEYSGNTNVGTTTPPPMATVASAPPSAVPPVPSEDDAFPKAEEPVVASSWGAVMNPIGHSIADLLRLPSHFGNLLHHYQAATTHYDPSNTCGSAAEVDEEPPSTSFVSRIDPEVEPPSPERVVKLDQQQPQEPRPNVGSGASSGGSGCTSGSGSGSGDSNNVGNNNGNGNKVSNSNSSANNVSNTNSHGNSKPKETTSSNTSSSKYHRSNRSSHGKKRGKKKKRDSNLDIRSCH